MSPQASAQPAPQPAGVAVDLDAAVWLAGPVAGDTHDERTAWVDGALAACATDFRVPAGSSEEQYLRDVLTEFATRDLVSDFRFLRLRAIDDAPLVARLDVHRGTPTGEVANALAGFAAAAEDGAFYDRTPRVETVDEDRGLRRLLEFRVDDGIRPTVRYHRRLEEWEVDIVLSCSGADLRATAEGLADLDALALAVWVVDDAGGRW